MSICHFVTQNVTTPSSHNLYIYRVANHTVYWCSTYFVELMWLLAAIVSSI